MGKARAPALQAMNLCRKDLGFWPHSRYQWTRDFGPEGIDRSEHGSQGNLR